MQPFKPYFRGEERRRTPRLTSCRSLPHARHRERRPDRAAPHVLRDARQLLLWRLLQGGRRGSRGSSRRRATGSTRTASGSRSSAATPSSGWARTTRPSRSGGGRRAGRAHRPPGARGQLLAVRPGRPVRPVLRLYLDRGLDFGGADDRPGDDTDRFLEFWNLVFMQYDLKEDGSITAAARAASTPGWAPTGWRRSSRTCRRSTTPSTSCRCIRFGEELLGPEDRDGGRLAATRALRILADHGRGMAFLMADGVVPSNEDRGYILRRIMRRAIQQGRVLGIDRLPCAALRPGPGRDGRRVPAARARSARRSRSGRHAEEESFGARSRRAEAAPES